MNIFVFDIETIPDISACREIYGLQGLDDAGVVAAVKAKRRGEGKSDFFPHYLQQIVAISCVLRTKDKVNVWSLGDLNSPEPELIERFFSGLARYVPTLVSWNGGGFDLPVLHYRALKHGIQAPLYWEAGDENRDFRYNNYLSRYHYRHIDLMDVLSGYQMRANAPLDHVASMLGFPGKMGMSGAKVFDAYQAGELSAIRDYCETDVLNTYLVFLAFEHMRGKLSEQALLDEHQQLKAQLEASNEKHLQDFLAVWNEGSGARSINQQAEP